MFLVHNDLGPLHSQNMTHKDNFQSCSLDPFNIGGLFYSKRGMPNNKTVFKKTTDKQDINKLSKNFKT